MNTGYLHPFKFTENAPTDEQIGEAIPVPDDAQQLPAPPPEPEPFITLSQLADYRKRVLAKLDRDMDRDKEKSKSAGKDATFGAMLYGIMQLAFTEVVLDDVKKLMKGEDTKADKDIGEHRRRNYDDWT